LEANLEENICFLQFAQNLHSQEFQYKPQKSKPDITEQGNVKTLSQHKFVADKSNYPLANNTKHPPVHAVYDIASHPHHIIHYLDSAEQWLPAPKSNHTSISPDASCKTPWFYLRISTNCA
jgi:hypothetical protein